MTSIFSSSQSTIKCCNLRKRNFGFLKTWHQVTIHSEERGRKKRRIKTKLGFARLCHKRGSRRLFLSQFCLFRVLPFPLSTSTSSRSRSRDISANLSVYRISRVTRRNQFAILSVMHVELIFQWNFASEHFSRIISFSCITFYNHLWYWNFYIICTY